MGNHAHHHHRDPSGRLLASIVLNGLITIAEITGGILSNSLALVSDAIHNLSDTLALILAWAANRIGGRKPDTRRTFGYRRLEILSAFINASVLAGISIWLMYEAVTRFVHPGEVRTGLMFVIALIGFGGNLVSMLFLRHDAHGNLNVKAAYIHLLGDTISSVAVIAGALVIRYTGYTWIDPLLTLVISIVIIRQAYGILRASVEILMQSTPEDLDIEEIVALLEQNPVIRNVHHVHCWQLEDHDIQFEAHVETSRDMLLSESNLLMAETEKLLREQFGITHTTLQFEFEGCGDASCSVNGHPGHAAYGTGASANG